jgi:hypothetical protein
MRIEETIDVADAVGGLGDRLRAQVREADESLGRTVYIALVRGVTPGLLMPTRDMVMRQEADRLEVGMLYTEAGRLYRSTWLTEVAA